MPPNNVIIPAHDNRFICVLKTMFDKITVDTIPKASIALTYPTFGVDLKYDKYFIGMSYIYGDQTLPVSNTFRLTINLEI